MDGSPYLDRPPRTEEEVRADLRRQARRDLNGFFDSLTQAFNTTEKDKPEGEEGKT